MNIFLKLFKTENLQGFFNDIERYVHELNNSIDPIEMIKNSYEKIFNPTSGEILSRHDSIQNKPTQTPEKFVISTEESPTVDHSPFNKNSLELRNINSRLEKMHTEDLGYNSYSERHFANAKKTSNNTILGNTEMINLKTHAHNTDININKLQRNRKNRNARASTLITRTDYGDFNYKRINHKNFSLKVIDNNNFGLKLIRANENFQGSND